VPIDRDRESERRERIDRLIEEHRRTSGSPTEQSVSKPLKARLGRTHKTVRRPKKSA
jgi:hypothetical protein